MCSLMPLTAALASRMHCSRPAAGSENTTLGPEDALGRVGGDFVDQEHGAKAALYLSGNPDIFALPPPTRFLTGARGEHGFVGEHAVDGNLRIMGDSHFRTGGSTTWRHCMQPGGSEAADRLMTDP